MSGIVQVLLATIGNLIQARKGTVSGQPLSDVGFGG